MRKRATISEKKWEQIKAEYMAGRQPRNIVAKYKVNPETLKKRVVREGWLAERKARSKKVAEIERDRVIELTAEFFVTEKIKYVREQVEDADRLIRRGMGMLQLVESSRDYYDIARAVRIGYDLKARALETDREKREREIDDAMQELMKVVTGTVTLLPAS